jgi:S-DNA-T family DNA segregation ATPase FtsK/SpoIIIE
MTTRTPVLPVLLQDFFKKRFRDLVGFGLLGTGVFLLTALWTYTPQDASWNTLTESLIPLNQAGPWGARIADMVRQIFGNRISYGIPPLFMVWGLLHVLDRHPVTLGRFLALGGGLSLLSLSDGLLFSVGAEPGLILLVLMHFKTMALFLNHILVKLILGLIVGTLGIGLYLFAFGLSLRFWKLSVLYMLQGAYTLWVLGHKGLSWIKDGLSSQTEAFVPVAVPHRRDPYLRPDSGLSPPASSSVSASFEEEENPEVILPELVSPALLSSQAFEAQPLVEPEQKKGFLSRAFSSPKPVKAPPPAPTRLASVVDNPAFSLPDISLLTPPPTTGHITISKADLERNIDRLSSVLADYGVNGRMVRARPGPVVTLYEFLPAPGVKSSRIIGLADDIARSMSALSARIAIIPGQMELGIELPNPKREGVSLRDVMDTDRFYEKASALTIALGKNISGDPVYTDLARMPHVIVAGTTGSGKSVAINGMILSLLYRHTPATCRLLMIDPKMLELSVYNGIPHLLSPVVTDPKKAIFALKWTVKEMENRYRAMSAMGVRNLEGYNNAISQALKEGRTFTRQVQTGFDPETGRPLFEEQHIDMSYMPYIVVIVDEMADLMMVAGKEIEAAVQRLAQMARAAGIHVIMATQRPSVDVITGTIKANFPTRISFQVASKFDSKTILGEQGAEQLLGRGDMLFMEAGGRIQRLHGPFVSDDEVERVVGFLKTQQEPNYVDTITEEAEEFGGNSLDSDEGGDALYRQACDIVRSEKKASTSFIQRRLQIGYNRAARLIEQMESEGLVSAPNHVGKREVLI